MENDGDVNGLKEWVAHLTLIGVINFLASIHLLGGALPDVRSKVIHLWSENVTSGETFQFLFFYLDG